MNKGEFLKEKMEYFIRHPQHTEMDFFHYLSKRYPDEAAGWFHLGQEWELRGKPAKALAFYRQAVRSQANSLFYDQAREAYHRMLRERRRQRLKTAARGLISFVLSVAVLFSFVPQLTLAPALGEHLQPPAVPDPPSPGQPLVHTEVIAVPAHLEGKELSEQVKRYLVKRRPYFRTPFTLLLVPEGEGLPLFSPLVFYRPHQVKGVIRYDTTTNKLIHEQYFSPACDCADQPEVTAAKKALAQEQLALEQAAILRNALYRYYQQTGRLPRHLSDLHQPHPANMLSALPRWPHPAAGVNENQPAASEWDYFPDRFQPANAWSSLQEVLPLRYYPEPSTPLEPLRIVVHKPTYTLLLLSGSHLVRRYPVGIGKNNATPDGYFTILQKINQPDGKGNIYGTRGMTFKNTSYAIHGTNNPDSIGRAMSLGCIRLYNRDVEELYSFVSPGTDVVITSQPQPSLAWSNGDRLLLPAGAREQTPGITYRWLH
ncbi:MAG: L,D-transpeptidase [Brevibacillus sp.]|nr:L,D-transpeptidase [Brevibacillus sp.]